MTTKKVTSIKEKGINILKDNPHLLENMKNAHDALVKEGIKPRYAYKIIDYYISSDINYTLDERCVSDTGKSWRLDDGGNYIIRVMDSEKTYNSEFIKNLFISYSNFGLRLTDSEICEKHHLASIEWSIIKKAFKIRRNILPSDPASLDKSKDAFESNTVKVEESIEEKAHKSQIKAYKSYALREANKYAKYNLLSRTIIDELNSFLKDESKTVYISRKDNKNSDITHLVVAITDLHAGSRVEGLVTTSDFNDDILKQDLSCAANMINNLNADKVTILFLGDAIESVSGHNHKSVFHNMEYGMYLSKAIFNGYEIMKGFIDEVNNVQNLLCVTGNHGRLTPTRDIDPYGEGEIILFELLKNHYSGLINVEYSYKVLAKNIEGINYIISHGDKRFSKNPEQLLIEYTQNKDFSVILQGHKHTREVLRDHRNYRFYTVPSIFSGNNWSDMEGYSSSKGFMAFYENNLGKLTALDYTL